MLRIHWDRLVCSLCAATLFVCSVAYFSSVGQHVDAAGKMRLDSDASNPEIQHELNLWTGDLTMKGLVVSNLGTNGQSSEASKHPTKDPTFSDTIFAPPNQQQGKGDRTQGWIDGWTDKSLYTEGVTSTQPQTKPPTSTSLFINIDQDKVRAVH